MKISDVMTTDVVTIGPDAPLKEAASRMVRSGVSGLPVVDQQMRLLGIITEADFVTAEANRSWGRQRRRLLAGYLGEIDEMSARTVGDSMSASPHTIDAESTVTEAARRMTEIGIKRLPVIDDDGVLEGIVSRADVMRAFARPDGALAIEIQASLEQFTDDRGERVTVDVKNGAVTLSGMVTFRTEVGLLEELASRVEGVTSVVSEVEYEKDDVDG